MAKPILKGKIKQIDKRERQRRLEKVLEVAKDSFTTFGIKNPEDTYPGSDVTVGQVAAWMEFGTHSKDGIERVPSRSFLRTPIDTQLDLVLKKRDQVLEKVIMGEMSIEKALDAIGQKMVNLSKSAITRGIAPKLANSTLRAKRALSQSDTPLLATRYMYDHIDFETTLN
ncbi:MAG: hypothetical protein EOO40_00195 [Deltaproteobacteria bacterium]|nr:MAG: hypothetical protein EOO40_00195 [Deltaproteobacteria bacterium]